MKRQRSAQCANSRLPEQLTEMFQERLLQLSPCVSADYLKKEAFSKFVSDATASPALRRERAIEKWLATEERNEATNEKLFNTPQDYNILPGVSLVRFVSICRSLISKIIGETVPVEALIGNFSGGASTSRKRTESNPASKYLGTAHVTARALAQFIAIGDEFPAWVGQRSGLFVETVPGNVMFTVPKETEIDRVACKEPDINMWLQKGVGSYIRRQLRHQQINLNDQSINRSLAQEGSLYGNLATMDLSSASDSISTGLVELLLPVCWYTLLDSIRSPVTTILRESGTEVHRNEMFSSMGNGFTFELESLLFFAIARTTAYCTGISGVVSVYGDDIICPSPLYSHLETTLNYFGFLVNAKKSYAEGPFRESCGGHYSDGFDITPFYVKGPIRHLTDAIRVANQLRSWAGRQTQLSILDPEVEEIWLWLKSYIPSYLWGGDDLSSITQLVSKDVSQCRLLEETEKQRCDAGGYLLWLNSTWHRTISSEGLETSTMSRTSSRYRVKKVRQTVPQLSQIFLSEV